MLDFGPANGIWLKSDAGAWQQVHSLSAESITTCDVDGDARDEIVVDFGPTYGVWLRHYNGVWEQINSLSPEQIICASAGPLKDRTAWRCRRPGKPPALLLIALAVPHGRRSRNGVVDPAAAMARAAPSQKMAARRAPSIQAYRAKAQKRPLPTLSASYQIDPCTLSGATPGKRAGRLGRRWRVRTRLGGTIGTATPPIPAYNNSQPGPRAEQQCGDRLG